MDKKSLKTTVGLPASRSGSGSGSGSGLPETTASPVPPPVPSGAAPAHNGAAVPPPSAEANTPEAPAPEAEAEAAKPAAPLTWSDVVSNPKSRFGAYLPLGPLLLSALKKFNPMILWHNTVLMLTWVGALVTTIFAIVESALGLTPTSGGAILPTGFSWALAIVFWISLYTATLAESLAEGRGRAQTSALRASRITTGARRVHHYDARHDASASRTDLRRVDAAELRPGNIIVLEAGETIPTDGEIIWGIGMVDESAITGESAPVIRESGGDRSAVTGGTKLLSDRIVVRVTAISGHSAIDRMIRLAEGAHRQKAPKEQALFALLASFSFAFVIVVLTLNAAVSPAAPAVSIPVLCAIVITLIPTEIAALMSVTGIASLYQLLHRGVLMDSGHSLETASDVTAVLLDKTGTITLGDRAATRFIALDPQYESELISSAILASTDDPTTEGRSIITLAQQLGYDTSGEWTRRGHEILFTAQTRMSGRDMPDGTIIRKGAESSVLEWLKHLGSQQSRQVFDELKQHTDAIARNGDTPLVVALKPPTGLGRVLGVIQLRDVVKPGIPARMQQLRSLGIKTVMLTGDNPLTAQAIAEEIGVDDFLGDATPEDKLAFIIKEQEAGHFVAMSGDGANDAPALAQADVGMAMNKATPTAKEAANMIILDDDPTKIVEIVEIGRRQMATRGALITFNMANDLVRYFTLYPALFVGTYPGLNALNLLHMHTAASAILSTSIFSIVVMGILIPLALFGVPYRLANLSRALSRNLLFYGVGGIVIAAVGIKLIDIIVSFFPGY